MRRSTRQVGLMDSVRRPWFRRDSRSRGAAPGTARPHRRWTSAGAVSVLALMTAMSGAIAAAAPASAATPEFEIKGRWVNQPDSISRGNPVVAEWRVNVNDAENPPSNDPVDNVTVEFTLDRAFFDEIPDLCLTEGVDPVSSISEDGTTLTCNFGTVNMGRAIVVQTPVIANGATGEEVVGDGTIDGQTAQLPPIPIVNPFVMDMQFTGTTEIRGRWNDNNNPRYVDVDLNWSLRLGKGSDVGPNEVTYRLDVGTDDGSPVNVGFHVRDQQRSGCQRFDIGNADGHPWSRTDIVPPHPASYRNTNFVDECILTEVSEGVFTLTLRGINYDILNAPTHDSWNAELPPNWNYIASGQLWFRVFTDNNGGITLDSNEPLYTAPTGQQYRDLAGNNTTDKTYVLPGSFSSAYIRGFTRNGGQRWDNSYRTSPGTTVQMYVANGLSTDDAAPGATYGNCLTWQHEYMTWDPNPPAPAEHGPIEVLVAHDDYSYDWLEPPPGQIQYYVGPAPADPDQFDCGSDPGNWTSTPPADPNDVKAIRHLFRYDTFENNDARHIQLRAFTKIRENVQVGQDIWQFGSALSSPRGWIGPDRGEPVQETPGARYPYTTGRRDILRIITANPHIEKEAAKATVTPGVPADFTLTYSATGTGSVPETVDDYQIVDTLPVGMTYEPGTADPEPVVTTDAQGRQVLNWTLDGVATNVEHELTYQAVVDSSVEPGTVLTNTAQSSLEGISTDPVQESVTTTNNGYTTILKTSDVEYIPNDKGDGVGSGSWTVTIESFDPEPQAYTDTIDILPYNGDGRGTSYAGAYTLDEMVVPDGATVYYTDAAPSTLSDDPADPSNGAAGDPTGNDVGWTTDRPDTVTAIRVIGPELEPGGIFSFQVPITTRGAEPQDVYVNRAQARAEHTELVMRTSASLTVTDYVVEKSSDPESGSTVEPGDTVTYTVKVTQQGDVPAGAIFRDRLTNVFDDATYNEDVSADIGEATLDGNVLRWRGTIPVGGTATITYSVTVNETDDPDKLYLKNVVTSPGCVSPVDCTTEHPGPGRFVVSKTSKPKPGTTVKVGDTVTYKVRIAHRGKSPVEDAKIVDDLSDVLDDATFNDDIEASAGTAERKGRKLRWTGDLNVGDVVKLTYSVTVREAGDNTLLNVVTPKGPGTCVPAPDGNPDCTTQHVKGGFTVSKTSNPTSGSTVDVGDTVTYKVRIEQQGKGPIEDAKIVDDLSEVLDDATFNHDIEASAGKASLDGSRLRWTGDLDVGEVVKLTYSVTVADSGDDELLNVVTPKGSGTCVPAPDENPGCTTRHDKAGPGGELPDTGSQVSGLTIAGAALMVLLGTGAVLFVRRRNGI